MSIPLKYKSYIVVYLISCQLAFWSRGQVKDTAVLSIYLGISISIFVFLHLPNLSDFNCVFQVRLYPSDL